MDDGYIVWRPHYHPILDEPIVEDPNLWKEDNLKDKRKAENAFDSGSDVDMLINYFQKYLSMGNFKPTLSLVNTNEDGTQTEQIIQDDRQVQSIRQYHDEHYGEKNDNRPHAKNNNNNRTRVSTTFSEKSQNIKVYGEDVNPFNKFLKQEVEEEAGKKKFVGINGMTVDEILKRSNSKPRRKAVQGPDGKWKMVTVVGKNKSKRKMEASTEASAGKKVIILLFLKIPSSFGGIRKRFLWRFRDGTQTRLLRKYSRFRFQRTVSQHHDVLLLGSVTAGPGQEIRQLSRSYVPQDSL